MNSNKESPSVATRELLLEKHESVHFKRGDNITRDLSNGFTMAGRTTMEPFKNYDDVVSEENQQNR